MNYELSLSESATEKLSLNYSGVSRNDRLIKIYQNHVVMRSLSRARLVCLPSSSKNGGKFYYSNKSVRL
jgi:hypothetical protein